MKKIFNVLAALMIFSQFAVHAQQTTGSLFVTVSDPTGAVVAGAAATVKNNATGAERTVTTSDDGTVTVTNLTPGIYSVSVESAGFKRTINPNVVVELSKVASLNLSLEVGLAGETITVTAGQEIVNTSSPSLTNVIDTRSVMDLPLPSRNPLDLAALQAGIAVVGSNNRGATIGGLRGSATNLTQDGITVTDATVKTDSLFAITGPSLNSIAEVSVTTGVVNSDSGRGAAQVALVTRSGTNEFHGGVFLLHRNEALNANTFFNNIAGTPRERQRQFFFGGDIGGPVFLPRFGEGGSPIFNGRDKAFFFFSYEGFRENFSTTRNRTVLTPEARTGIFRYTGTNGQLQSVNLLSIGNVGTLNPITSSIIGGTPLPNNTLVGDGFNTSGFRFNVTGSNVNDKYVGRYDHQLVTDTRLGSHKLEFTLNKNIFSLTPDTFNGIEAPFTGGDNAGQGSTRYLLSTALVSNFGNSTNVFRYGRLWGPTGFIRETFPSRNFVVFSSITSPDLTFLSQGRELIQDQFSNNFTVSKGSHLFKIGFDTQDQKAISFNDTGINQTINIGSNSANPVGILLSELPFGTNTDVSRASAVYSDLVGNLGSSSVTFNITSPTSGFVARATRSRLIKERDTALYASDQWRVKNNFTLTFGLRYEFIGVPTVPDGVAIQPTNAFDVYGVSGNGNLFNPTAPAGAAPAVASLDFVSGETGRGLYKNDLNNFAPFIGIAYSPDFKSGILRSFFGETGKSSIRAGYSVSYLRDGFTVISNVLGVGTTNPGLIQTAANTTPTGVLTTAGVPLTTPVFAIPITDRANNLINPGNGIFSFDPNLRTPYVQQWSVGFEREILPNTAIEVRYVGNKASKTFRAYDINEVNIFENGFLDEFKRAKANLAARGGTSFAPGCIGCVDLPILNRFFTGLSSTSTLGFASSGFISNLNNDNVGTFASTLAFSNTYRTARETAANGIPANFFVANPNAAFARILTNESESSYHSLQIELRRRFSNGLQFQADYTLSRAETNGSDAYNSQNDLSSFRTLRDKDLDFQRAAVDQTHRFVANGVYELPFGKGKYFLGGTNSFMNYLVGGFSVGTIVNYQSRPPFFISAGRTTFNSFNSGNNPAKLVGISFDEFKKNLGVYRTPAGVFFVNPELLNITTNPVTGRFVSSTLKPGLLGAPAPGEFGDFPRNELSGPRYFNIDLSITKRIPLGERVRFELKTTFINLLNNTNFVFNSQNFDATNFGQITGQSGSSRVVHFTGSVRF